MKFKIRSVRPDVSQWEEVEADTVEDAIQILHDRNIPFDSFRSLKYTHYFGESQRNDIYFAAFEVDNLEGECISRIYNTGIWRKGGVVGKQPTIQEMAAQLGWTKSPEELLGGGWAGEESWDAARERKWGSK